MHKRAWIAAGVILTLAACDPKVPDSAAGVGFGDYAAYQLEKKRKIEAERAVRERQISGETTVTTPGATGAPTPAEALQQPVVTAEADTPTPPPASSVITPAQSTQVARTGAISDEQDFGAVSSRESIESDAARLARLRAERQQVSPTALPTRQGQGGPNIVEFALRSSNQPGQPIYKRGFASKSREARNCAAYTSPDKAQQAFLEMGGPQRDRKSLDSDGDGFACGWDPRPFRKAVQG